MINEEIRKINQVSDPQAGIVCSRYPMCSRAREHAIFREHDTN